MYGTAPAMVIAGRRGAVAHAALAGLTATAILWFVVSALSLHGELIAGATGVGEYWGFRFPEWIAPAAGLPFAVGAAVESFADWSATGSQHGRLDHRVVPSGLRISRLRKLGRSLDVVVERGERLEIRAEHVHQRRLHHEREHRFTVTAPGGTFSFTQPIHIEKLSLAPLDAVARDPRIEVLTNGAAGAPPPTPRSGRFGAAGAPTTPHM